MVHFETIFTSNTIRLMTHISIRVILMKTSIAECAKMLHDVLTEQQHCVQREKYVLRIHVCTLFLHRFLTSVNILLLDPGTLRHSEQRSNGPSSKFHHNLAPSSPYRLPSSLDLAAALIRQTINQK